jgi:hypothetical protein
MPLKGYKYSEEVKARRKEQYKGFSNSGTFKKGNKSWNEGKKRPPFSKEWIEKLRVAHLGNKSHTGEVHDEAYKRRMSEATKGKIVPPEVRKKISVSRTGIIFSPEHRKNLSIGHMNPDRAAVIARCGGRRCKEHRDWSRAVKVRDGWKCKINDKYCEGRLESHHILSYLKYPELRYDVNNGIALCRHHHPKTREKEENFVGYFNSLLAQVRT